MNDLEASVVEVAALLESLSIPHMLVGGLARCGAKLEPHSMSTGPSGLSPKTSNERSQLSAYGCPPRQAGP